MKDYFKFRQELNEAKVTIAKLKAGLKVNVIHKGRSAKNFGVDGQNVYGGKVQVLGIGIVPFGKPAEKRHVIGKDWKDLENKHKDIWKSEDIQFGQFWNANDRKNAFLELVAKKLKMKQGWTCWIWQVIEGENKGKISYCYIDRDEKWSVTFLNKSTEFILES